MQPVEPDAGTDQIRRRAYEIWQEEGQPEGRDQDHWDQAVRERLGTSERLPDAPPSDTASQDGAAPAGEGTGGTTDLLAEDSAAAAVEADYAKRMLAGHPDEGDAEGARAGD